MSRAVVPEPPERPQRPPRAAIRPRVPLTRERILRAALALADREGLEALTMRRLGQELGVEAMSLYVHVEGKEGVLDGLVETLLSEVTPPPPGVEDWTERARFMARSFRRVAREHPNVLRLIVTRPVHTPGALRPIDTALGTLRRAGLDEDALVPAYHTVTSWLIGFLLLEVGGILAGPENAARLAADLEGLPAGEFPNLMHLAPWFLTCDPDREFENGLDILLQGVAASLRSRPAAEDPAVRS